MTDQTELVGNVVNAFSTSAPDNSDNPLGLGRQTEQLVSEIHGKYYTANYRKVLFGFNVTAVTVPVVASGLVSVFSLYNPAGSPVNLEIVDFDMGLVLATTVVDVLGLYTSSIPLTAKGTFTTAGSPVSGVVGSGLVGYGVPYSAYTHSGTPTRHSILATFGAVTDAQMGSFNIPIDGKIIIPPGVIVSAAMSTAAGTAAGIDLGVRWLEVPL